MEVTAHQVRVNNKFLCTLKTYDGWIIRLIPSANVARHPRAETLLHKAEHLRWMAQEGIMMVERGNLEKATRWMGYIEGSLVQLGFATLEEIQMLDILSYVPEETVA